MSQRSDEEQTAPAVKAWLDSVLVPAMVRQWLAERQAGQAPALTDTPDESHSSGDATGDDVRR